VGLDDEVVLVFQSFDVHRLKAEHYVKDVFDEEDLLFLWRERFEELFFDRRWVDGLG
jgi:hypothetical protein